MIKSLYPQFQKWSATGSVWIISDPHFADPETKLINPEWPDADDLVAIINTKVMKGDTLVCLGDVGDPKYVKKIKAGYKVLITGNHDAGASSYQEYFNEIYTGPLFISDRILLSHEPIYFLEDFCLNIHGHVHCQESPYREYRHVCLAADVVGYQPFNLGAGIKNGLLSGIPNYHRLTIDEASKSPIHKEKSE